MKVTYLDNSGFVITLKDAILVFDYYRDPSHALNKILGDKPDAPVVFFVSHRHPDHYNPGIYEIAQNHRRVYVMSNDVPAMKIPSTLEVQGMSVGDYVESLPGGISVRAYGSTDAGVSFLVTSPMAVRSSMEVISTTGIGKTNRPSRKWRRPMQPL